MKEDMKYIIVKQKGDSESIETTSKGEDLVFKERVNAVRMARLWEKFATPDIKFTVKEKQ
tara:strand:+ start:4806 stop:4985 length:180 start_codon:yes stop_codon:yes gene_type:complete